MLRDIANFAYERHDESTASDLLDVHVQTLNRRRNNRSVFHSGSHHLRASRYESIDDGAISDISELGNQYELYRKKISAALEEQMSLATRTSSNSLPKHRLNRMAHQTRTESSFSPSNPFLQNSSKTNVRTSSPCSDQIHGRYAHAIQAKPYRKTIDIPWAGPSTNSDLIVESVLHICYQPNPIKRDSKMKRFRYSSPSSSPDLTNSSDTQWATCWNSRADLLPENNDNSYENELSLTPIPMRPKYTADQQSTQPCSIYSVSPSHMSTHNPSSQTPLDQCEISAICFESSYGTHHQNHSEKLRVQNTSIQSSAYHSPSFFNSNVTASNTMSTESSDPVLKADLQSLSKRILRGPIYMLYIKNSCILSKVHQCYIMLQGAPTTKVDTNQSNSSRDFSTTLIRTNFMTHSQISSFQISSGCNFIRTHVVALLRSTRNIGLPIIWRHPQAFIHSLWDHSSSRIGIFMLSILIAITVLGILPNSDSYEPLLV